MAISFKLCTYFTESTTGTRIFRPWQISKSIAKNYNKHTLPGQEFANTSQNVLSPMLLVVEQTKQRCLSELMISILTVDLSVLQHSERK